MDTDQRGPAYKAQIAIRAPLETIWRIQTDIDRWSAWNAKVQRAKLEGPLETGSVFKWKSGGASIVSTLQKVEPMRKIAWTGKAAGARARHVWIFEQREDVVVVTTQEAFDGWWPRLFPGLTRTMLAKLLRAWLQDLKHHAEASASP